MPRGTIAPSFLRTVPQIAATNVPRSRPRRRRRGGSARSALPEHEFSSRTYIRFRRLPLSPSRAERVLAIPFKTLRPELLV